MTTPKPRSKAPSPLKTYSHLGEAGRMPTEYELVTSRLHAYVPRGGFELDAPLAGWYARYQRGSPLAADDWDRFVDPRETTYTKYVTLARAREIYVDGLFEANSRSGHDAELRPEWLDILDRFWPVLRYPFHALQMLAAYVGQMAPSGRITVAASLQAADEVRRIQRVAYRTVELRAVRPGFGERSRHTWEEHDAWQPLRRALEEALVAFDWGESFVATNVVLKPLLDELVLVHAPRAAADHGDPLLGMITSSLRLDAEWQREWTRALVRFATAERAENRAVIEGWARAWAPRARAAMRGLEILFAPARFEPALEAFFDDWLTTLGLGAE